MHQLKSPQTLRCFRLASLLFCIKCLAMAAAVVILMHATVVTNWHRALLGFGVAGFSLFVGMCRALLAGHARCPLCMTPVFSNVGCSKHRRARNLLGSYRLRVALAILFRNHFYCPYCNEPTAMKLRPRPHPVQR